MKIFTVFALLSLLAESALANETFSFGACKVVRGDFDLEYSVDAEVPDKARVGVSTAYNNGRHNIETVWHPIPKENSKDAVFDLTAFSLGEALPERFVLGDGALKRVFFAIDQRPGTKLDSLLKLFTTLVPGVKNGRVVNERVLTEYLQTNLGALVGFRWRPGGDAIGENRWDPRNFKVTEEMRQAFANSTQLAPKSGYYATKGSFPVIPFEQFLERGCAAYCIQKSVLLKLLFDRLHFKARLVTGSVITFGATGFESEGHTWVEYKAKDGKDWIIDPEHKLLGPKGEQNDVERDWFWFNGVNRRENQYFPILKLG